MHTHRKLMILAVSLLAFSSAASALAQNPATSPVYRTRSGANKVQVYQKFTTTLQHSARIKSVLDFDDAIIRIDPVQGHPDQVTIYALDTGVTTVTLIDEFDQFTKIEVLVMGDVRHLQDYLRRHYPNDSIHVEEVKGAVLLNGWVTRPESINQIVEIAEQFFPTVLNHMRIGGVQQVMLKATVMEVNRSKIRQMGMNFGLIGNEYWANSTPGPITPITGLTAASGATEVTFTGFANTSASIGFVNPSVNFRGFIQALKTEGLLKIHATPMVVTHNGQRAELLNGGETPVLVPAGLGTTAIEFKPFGIIMQAVPHILGNGRLRLQVEPSVVERDFANAITVDGITVPSFTVRKVTTEVEMNFGQTLVIGGLVNKREDGSTAKLPFFGELPWIGAAFSQKTYTEAETELIILITPEYVAPMSPEEVPAGGPGKFTDTPTATELHAYGFLEVPRVGSECDSVFNCMECDGQGGYCSRCGGSGKYRGSCADGNCGAGCGDGCSDGCGDTLANPAQPVLIQPQDYSAPLEPIAPLGPIEPQAVPDPGLQTMTIGPVIESGQSSPAEPSDEVEASTTPVRQVGFLSRLTKSDGQQNQNVKTSEEAPQKRSFFAPLFR